MQDQVIHPVSRPLVQPKIAFKPFLAWVAFLTSIFSISMWYGGYQVALPLAILLSVWIIVKNADKGLPATLIYAMLFLSLFDNESFIFNVLGLSGFRVRYPAIFILEICWFLAFLAQGWKPRKVSRGAFLVFLTTAFLILFSLVFFIYEPAAAKLFAIKYWVFNFLPIIIVPIYLAKARDEHFYSYFLSLMVFVCLFGFVQIVIWKSGNLNLISPEQYGFAINPVGFFSERTWFGLFAAFGLPILFYLRESRKVSGFLFSINLIILIIAVILSQSRNAYLGMAVCLVLAALVSFKRTIIISMSILVVLVASSLVLPTLVKDTGSVLAAPARSLVSVWSSFTQGTESSVGRLSNFATAFQRYQDGTYSWFGNGFAFDPETEALGAGGAIGAKSNNVFFFIFHIFGLQGLVLVFILLVYFYQIAFRRCRRNPKLKYSLIMMTMWLLMAQFAPLHQQGIGVMILCVILGMFISGQSELKLSVYYENSFST